MDADQPTDDGADSLAPEELNPVAVGGVVVSVLVGVAGLFALPAIQQSLGLPFLPAFGVVLAVELVATVGVVVSVLNLHRRREYE
jgi:hypothetical protein